jgi:tagaturonate reductase
VVVVQQTGDERAQLMNRQHGRYHVLVRGLAGGATVDRQEESRSISRALVASRQWEDVRAVVRSPELSYILSNTAETGYTLDAEDRPDRTPPRSFPAKLLLLLNERFQAGQPGVTLLPCELFEHNADLLLGLLVKLSEEWQLPEGLRQWMRNECVWRNCLVDRIVTNPPPDHPLLAQDPLLVSAEPFAFWAIEVKDNRGSQFSHSAIRTAADINPFFLRKVRILNAAHTALVARTRDKGIVTVLEAMNDPTIVDWLQRLLFDEIVPTLAGRVEQPAEFARQTLERFRNPFLQHKLSDIAVYHDAKVKIRLVPTRTEFVEKFGRPPQLLDEAIAH